MVVVTRAAGDRSRGVSGSLIGTRPWDAAVKARVRSMLIATDECSRCAPTRLGDGVDYFASEQDAETIFTALTES